MLQTLLIAAAAAFVIKMLDIKTNQDVRRYLQADADRLNIGEPDKVDLPWQGTWRVSLLAAFVFIAGITISAEFWPLVVTSALSGSIALVHIFAKMRAFRNAIRKHRDRAN